MFRAFYIINHETVYCRLNFHFSCLLDVLPLPVLTFGFCIGADFIYVYKQSYTCYEYWWYTLVKWCHENCYQDDNDIVFITDDPANVSLLAASASCYD